MGPKVTRALLHRNPMQSNQRSFQYLKNDFGGAIVFLENLKKIEALFLRKRNGFLFSKSFLVSLSCYLSVYVYNEGLGLYGPLGTSGGRGQLQCRESGIHRCQSAGLSRHLYWCFPVSRFMTGFCSVNCVVHLRG